MLHLGHIAIRAGKVVDWDPQQERFLKDQQEHEADIVYRRESRNWEKEA